MLCRGTSTLQSSSLLTTTKKKQKSLPGALGTVTRAPSAAWATFLPQVWACSVCRQCPIAPAGSPQFVSLPEVSLACRMICCSIPANPRRAATLKQTPPCCSTELSKSWETHGKLLWGGGHTHFRNPASEDHYCHCYTKYFTRKKKTIGEKGKNAPCLKTWKPFVMLSSNSLSTKKAISQLWWSANGLELNKAVIALLHRSREEYFHSKVLFCFVLLVETCNS